LIALRDAAASRACAVCGRPGATVRCAGCSRAGGCAAAFHYPCARVAAAGGAVLFADSFVGVACGQHYDCILQHALDPGEQQFAGLW
jgi:hypothetical protein